VAGNPARVTLSVKGDKELVRALDHMERDVQDLTDTNLRAARIVAQDAQKRSPKRSGKLARSVRVRAKETSGSVVFGGRLVPYAGPIHNGWPKHNIKANPFLTEALAARAGQVAEEYERRIGDLVERVGRETP